MRLDAAYARNEVHLILNDAEAETANGQSVIAYGDREDAPRGDFEASQAHDQYCARQHHHDIPAQRADEPYDEAWKSSYHKLWQEDKRMLAKCDNPMMWCARAELHDVLLAFTARSCSRYDRMAAIHTR